MDVIRGYGSAAIFAEGCVRVHFLSAVTAVYRFVWCGSTAIRADVCRIVEFLTAVFAIHDMFLRRLLVIFIVGLLFFSFMVGGLYFEICLIMLEMFAIP